MNSKFLEKTITARNFIIFMKNYKFYNRCAVESQMYSLLTSPEILSSVLQSWFNHKTVLSKCNHESQRI